jgi:hypothetical protein
LPSLNDRDETQNRLTGQISGVLRPEGESESEGVDELTCRWECGNDGSLVFNTLIQSQAKQGLVWIGFLN